MPAPMTRYLTLSGRAMTIRSCCRRGRVPTRAITKPIRAKRKNWCRLVPFQARIPPRNREAGDGGPARYRRAACLPAAAPMSIAHELRDAIVGGRYASGQRLPPERRLATHYNASRATIREALRQLTDQQLVERRHRQRHFRHLSPGDRGARDRRGDQPAAADRGAHGDRAADRATGRAPRQQSRPRAADRGAGDLAKVPRRSAELLGRPTSSSISPWRPAPAIRC